MATRSRDFVVGSHWNINPADTGPEIMGSEPTLYEQGNCSRRLWIAASSMTNLFHVSCTTAVNHDEATMAQVERIQKEVHNYTSGREREREREGEREK